MLRGISKLNGFLLIGVFLVLMYMIYELNILPITYFMAIGGVLALFVLLFVFKLVRRKTGFVSRIVFNIFSIVLILASIYGMTYINATNNFLNNLIAKNFETVTYDVVVNSNGYYNDIKDLNNKNVGHLKNDTNYHLLKIRMATDLSFKPKEYNDVETFENNIENGLIDAVVVQDSYYEMLKEEYSNLEKSTKVIKKYNIIVKKDNKKKIKQTSREPFLVYISGIDTYGNITSVSRSDVNLLLAVNPKNKKMLLVSIPRDYYVQLHGTTGLKDKLTHAGIYSIDMSMNTINDLLDTKIDYFVRINFSTLTKSIDLLDGIDVYSDKTFTPYTNKNMTINEGVNHMNGEMALAFARERYTYATGDRHRGQNQQAIITAMIKKLTNGGYVTKYKDILQSLDGSFETSMRYEEMTELFKMQIEKKIDWNVESISLDGTGSQEPTYSMGNRKLYVMIPNQATINNAKEKLNEYLKK